MNLWSVIPAQNEERTIAHVIGECLAAGSSRVLVVCNGSSDRTAGIAQSYPDTRVTAFWEPEPLGMDVPRAIGAIIAHRHGADGILFCDGDLSGKLAAHLSSLLATIARGFDLSLTDCYPRGLPYGGMAGRVIEARLDLNSSMGRHDLGAAVMSHGPSCISRRFMDSVPYQALAIPPLAQALAVKQGLKVSIGGVLAHQLLGSRERRGSHPEKIADLIIGDCVLAKWVFNGGLPARCEGRRAYIGFDNTRRWDLLKYHADRITAQTELP
ncbi:MAG: glycosyltransferase family 2 protein [Bacillota bacterium]|jgi:glycosyltransferase involved in cell wall biosynthesis|nr:glycosyltransferase family 2 protein [Candidatus Fermentithermobacillaceae bacterium]